jgi:elongation factor Tu
MSAKSKDVAILGGLDAGKNEVCAALTKVSATKYGGNATSFSGGSQLSLEVNGPKHKYTLHYGLADKGTIENGGAANKTFDLAIVVVSALEGGRPADAEQVRAVKAGGCERFVVFMSKCDMLEDDTEMLDLAEASIRDVLDSAGLVGKEVEVVRGSARVAVRDDTESQKSLVKLFEALEKITA